MGRCKRERGGAYRERMGGRERANKGKREVEREVEKCKEREREHHIHIFYVRGGYFQGSSNYFRFSKVGLKFLV
jgi:hypothetical protein